jgi:RNA polymerase sigma-70 factor (ECF subfamily)
MDQPTSNEDLMTAVRDGHLEALAALFERHHRPLFGYARGRSGDTDRAEDVVQETFSRILRYRRSYRPGAPFVPWMLRIARNVLQAEGAQSPDLALTAAAEVKASDDPVRDLERKQRREQVMAGLAELAEEDRDLLLLSHVQELPRQEIAHMLGITTNAAKVRIHRALATLRRQIVGADHGEAKS